MFEGKTVLVTGGTGSFGTAFARRMLDQSGVSRLIVLSRDEMKQWEMAHTFSDSRLRFFLGDVRDRHRLRRAFEGVDYVVHAAASKIVPSAEYNPFETVKTNVLGAMNVIDAAIDSEVQSVVALSTDKASNPLNLYGATKLTSDKLFVASNSYAANKPTIFSVVRYGNVMGSRGSVIPAFIRARTAGNPLPITDERMTRFMMSLDQGIDLVLTAFSQAFGGETFIGKAPSMRIVDVANALDPRGKREFTGIRPGEKLHEQMIGVDDADLTWDFGNFYKLLPTTATPELKTKMAAGGKRVPTGFTYDSQSNPEQMTQAQLLQWLSGEENLDR